MKPALIRKYALSLPEATEEPHFQYASFRVRGKIFMTAPPGERYIQAWRRKAPKALAATVVPS